MTNTATMKEHGAASEFQESMASAGLAPPGLPVGDGRMRRFRVEGDSSGSQNGWYVLHLDHRPSGAFGSWKAQVTHTWSSRRTSDAWTGVGRLKRDNQASRQMVEAERSLRHESAALRAVRILGNSLPAPADHPYLVRKRIGPHGLTVGYWPQRQLRNVLFATLTDIEGEVVNLQAIFPTTEPRLGRDKDFLSGGRIEGCFFLLGKPRHTSERLIICEGVATGASLYEAVGYPVLCSMSAGNLLPVARFVRERWTEAGIYIAGDNDRGTPGNPGATKAREAALAIGGKLVLPEFPDGSTGTDWNDWVCEGRSIPDGPFRRARA